MSPVKFTLRAESPSIFLDKSGLTVDLSRKIEGDSACRVYRTVHVWYEQKALVSKQPRAQNIHSTAFDTFSCFFFFCLELILP